MKLWNYINTLADCANTIGFLKKKNQWLVQDVKGMTGKKKYTQKGDLMFKKKYNEEIVYTSISMPLSLKRKIDDRSIKYRINKNALMVIYLLKGVELTEEEINLIHEKKKEMYNQKEEIQDINKDELQGIINKEIQVKDNDYKNRLRETNLSNYINFWVEGVYTRVKLHNEDINETEAKKLIRKEFVKRYARQGEMFNE